MSQVFDEQGNVYPATIIEATPMTVIQVKDKSKDGYKAVQIGGGRKSAKNINKSKKGHLKGSGEFGYLKEYRLNDDDPTPAFGDKIDPTILSAGDMVTVSAVSKSKGFQGVVKRHGFKGGPRSHGQKHSEREPGSISGGTRNGGRVPKAMRMAGRTGGERITVKNLKVLKVDSENNSVYIGGAIPGRKGTLVEIRG